MKNDDPFNFTEGSSATEISTSYIGKNSDYIGVIFWGRNHQLVKKYRIQMTIC